MTDRSDQTVTTPTRPPARRSRLPSKRPVAHGPDGESDRVIRPDLIEEGRDRLSAMEKLQIRAIRRMLEPGRLDSALRVCQRVVGSAWITFFTNRVRHVHGLDRLPPLDPKHSFICVSNHRSFFDLYVITGHLVSIGLPHRLVFPVRSEFFYDSALGFFVNGVMSFFAMYPPVFRDRQRAALNLVGLDEIAFILQRGGAFVGVHPEGRRNKDGDPYTLLPAQSGVGRLIHRSKVTVIPVFINGLVPDDLYRQVKGNFNGTGDDVHIVFGPPVDFGTLMSEPGSPRVYKAIAERARNAIMTCGEEEKRIRSER
jgi:1-acyl-sn-glycerol-3-phosphate acyltransferase